jgi:hypothetical protein
MTCCVVTATSPFGCMIVVGKREAEDIDITTMTGKATRQLMYLMARTDEGCNGWLHVLIEG